MTEVIDGNWIARRLTGARGEKAQIARAMGIDPQKLSKTLMGKRQVQPAEIPGLLAHFGLANRNGPGMSESPVTPLDRNQDEPTLAVVAALSTGHIRTEAFRARESLPVFGILRGDILIVDLANTAPDDGDLVLANRPDPHSDTRPARFMRGLLSYADPTDPPETAGDTAAILGVVIGCARGRSITQQK